MTIEWVRRRRENRAAEVAAEHRRRRLANVVEFAITTAGRRYVLGGAPVGITVAEVRERAADDGLDDVGAEELAELLRARIAYRQPPGVVLADDAAGPGR